MILFLATGLPLRADTLKLKDGTVLEGEITSEDKSAVSIYLEFSHGTITQTRRINKAEIVEIIRWTPEQKENWRMQRDYERLQAYRLNAKDSYLMESYDQTIGAFQKFLSDHPDSPYTSNVTARIAEWKAERTLVSAGNIKFRGRWSPTAEVGPLIAPERGKKMLEQARWLISQRRFESAIPELQVVVHMKDHPELVSQAKPLLTSAYQQAQASLEHESQRLSNDVAAAAVRITEARRAVNEAEFLLTQEINSQQSTNASRTTSKDSVSQAQVALNKVRGELNAAQNHFDQLQDQRAVVVQRMTSLKLQARDVSAGLTISQAPPPPPTTPSSDSPEVLVTIVAWVKKNWPGMLIALLAILFLMSRLAKD
jgi:TolA-binding protein